MKSWFPQTNAEKRRFLEVGLMLASLVVLVSLSRLEVQLYDLSGYLAKSPDFFATVLNFALINFNVILILILSFLLFRNVAKLVVERRRGIFGSNLRIKLVATLMFFALVPTLLYFYVSARFVVGSFDEWFSGKIRQTMHETREVTEKVYRQDQRRLENLARLAALKLKQAGMADGIKTSKIPTLPAHVVEGFDVQSGLDSLVILDLEGHVLWGNRGQQDIGRGQTERFVLDAIEKFIKNPTLISASTVIGEDRQDIVKGIAPVLSSTSGQIIGVVVTETKFEAQVLQSIEAIQEGFAKLKPSAQLIKISYLVLLVMMTLVVVFSAMWLGFYVARGITGPIQALAEGTKEVALGNYNITLNTRSDDETGQLVRSFNHMTEDLRRHRSQVEEGQRKLLESNEELSHRGKFLEILLKSMTSGVIAVDKEGVVRSVNQAASQILNLEASPLIGRSVDLALGAEFEKELWLPALRALQDQQHYAGQIEVTIAGVTVALLVDIARIVDENGDKLGIVMVFDDASEKIKFQRIAAWREVARRIAHEIKNPVTPIKLNAQRLLRKFHDRFTGSEQDIFVSSLETILHQVDSLRDLVNEFSKFSRLPQISVAQHDLNDVVYDVVNLYRLSYPNVKFDTSGLGNVPLTLIDKDQVNRVLVNIISNALQALEQGVGEHCIKCTSEFLPVPNVIRLEISDNGPGIPEEIRDRVLEPYFSTKDGGTGLGLAIVNQIVADHGGYLRISGNEPHGTRITVELPVRQG